MPHATTGPEVDNVLEKIWGESKSSDGLFYKLSQDSNYIRRYRVKKDQKWTVDSEYGKLDITINLSKPEKDPKAIAAARNVKSGSYPKCLLCPENEGYAGRVNHPGKTESQDHSDDHQRQRMGISSTPMSTTTSTASCSTASTPP